MLSRWLRLQLKPNKNVAEQKPIKCDYFRINNNPFCFRKSFRYASASTTYIHFFNVVKRKKRQKSGRKEKNATNLKTLTTCFYFTCLRTQNSNDTNKKNVYSPTIKRGTRKHRYGVKLRWHYIFVCVQYSIGIHTAKFSTLAYTRGSTQFDFFLWVWVI